MAENADNAVFQTIRAMITLLGDEKLQDTLRDESQAQNALAKMDMPESARSELLNLLNRMERIQERAVSQARKGNSDQSSQAQSLTPDEQRYERMQLEAFDHIRISFWVSLSMSIILFLIGMVLMGIAVAQAVRETAVSTSTLTIAGLGLADFVLLFFRRPWQDVSVNLANSQQVRTVATSYLAGLALLQRGDLTSLKLLNDLTKRSVDMLEQYTKIRDEPRPETPTAADS